MDTLRNYPSTLINNYNKHNVYFVQNTGSSRSESGLASTQSPSSPDLSGGRRTSLPAQATTRGAREARGSQSQPGAAPRGKSVSFASAPLVSLPRVNRTGRCSRCNGTLPEHPPAAAAGAPGDAAHQSLQRSASTEAAASYPLLCFQRSQMEFLKLVREMHKHHPEWSSQKLEEEAQIEMLRRGPKSFAFYRIQSIRTLTGAPPHTL